MAEKPLVMQAAVAPHPDRPRPCTEKGWGYSWRQPIRPAIRIRPAKRRSTGRSGWRRQWTESWSVDEPAKTTEVAKATLAGEIPPTEPAPYFAVNLVHPREFISCSTSCSQAYSGCLARCSPALM